MQRKYILLGITIMLSGALLTGALQNIFLGGDSFIALRTFVGYAIMGLGIFGLKRGLQSTNIMAIGAALALFLIGSIINGKLFDLINGDAFEYAKYFGGIAALSIGGWISKHSLLGGE